MRLPIVATTATILLVLGVALLAGVSTQDAAGGGGDSLTSPDTVGDVGTDTSLQLDALGNPVVSYFDLNNDDLKILHCNDPNCDGAGQSITAPDTDIDVGRFTSLQLDALGYPVVSYNDHTNEYLKVLHCDDPDCSGVGESIATPENPLSTDGSFTSLQLDASGNPVVSYSNAIDGDLQILHCDDPKCGGAGQSITSPDTTRLASSYTSLQLDAVGNPVVSYYDLFNGNLKVLHCNDVNCTGANESIESPDTTGNVGLHTSLRLDASGNPVVSYQGNGDLKILHCDDPNCASGIESITSPDTVGDVGQFTSLQLDASGNPVVSYYDLSNGSLKILHCNDPNCSGDDESITSPDTTGNVGRYTSLQLDAAGNPVVSYYDLSNGNLKILHCDDPNCAPPATPTPSPTPSPTPTSTTSSTPSPTATPTATPSSTVTEHDQSPDGPGTILPGGAYIYEAEAVLTARWMPSPSTSCLISAIW